ncbi:MAG: LytR/AlgR family response regulator transcription factor [Bacteroidales bacterium]
MTSFLIVDDEGISRRLIKNLLLKLDSDFKIYEASNVDGAVDLYFEKKPDLVFMDIIMPRKNGFEFMNILKNYNTLPNLVVMSSCPDYAIDALRESVLDYLEKPIRHADLKNCLIRVQKRINYTAKLPQNINGIEKQLQLQERIKIFASEKISILALKDIFYCEANSNYTNIYLTNKEKITTSLNLGKIQKQLPSNLFFRTHRSYIVNETYITSINRRKKCCLIKCNDAEAEIKITESSITKLMDLI